MVAATIGEGEDLVDMSGEAVFEASPIANAAARRRSSRVDLCGLFEPPGLFCAEAGLPARWVASDFRRLMRADSASWLEDSGEDGRA